MLEKLLQFVLKLMPKPIKNLFYKYESIWRYCYYGAWTTVVSFASFLLAKFALQAMGFSLKDFIPLAIANVFSWICAVVFAFVVNKKYVFMSKTDTKKELLYELGTFTGARVASLGIEAGFMAITVNLLHWNDVLMKIIAQVVVLIINYVFSKLVIFKKARENKDSEKQAE